MLWWTLRKLKSASAPARQAAAQALRDNCDPAAIGPLVVALADESRDVRRAAGSALERTHRWWESPAARGAAPELIALLQSGDLERRRAAAEALGLIRAPAAVPALLAVLGDGSRPVRSGRSSSGAEYIVVQTDAVDALVAIEGPAAARHLTEILRRTPREWGAVQAAAAGLGRLGDASAVEPLIEVLACGPPPNARDEVCLALARIGHPSAAVPLARALAQRGEPALQAVVEALRTWADPATAEPLSLAAQAGSPTALGLLVALDPSAACRALPAAPHKARISAASALLRAGRADALPAALGVLRDIGDSADVLAISKNALPDIESFLDSHAGLVAESDLQTAAGLENAAVRVVDEGCGYYGGGVSRTETLDLGRIRQLARREMMRRDPVASACASGNWDAVAAMGEAALPSLAWLMTVSHAPDRAQMVKAIGRIGGRAGLAPLLAALKDDDAAVRIAAAEGLARLGDFSTAHPLVVALQDRDSGVRLVAADALAALGPAAIKPLTSALRNKDHAIRRIATAVLARIADPAAADLLGQALSDRDAGVREAACEGLAALEDARAADTLISSLAGTSPGRAAALLTGLLEKAASGFSEGQLRSLAALPADGAGTSTAEEHASRLSELARRELGRRGLEA